MAWIRGRLDVVFPDRRDVIKLGIVRFSLPVLWTHVGTVDDWAFQDRLRSIIIFTIELRILIRIGHVRLMPCFNYLGTINVLPDVTVQKTLRSDIITINTGRIYINYIKAILNDGQSHPASSFLWSDVRLRSQQVWMPWNKMFVECWMPLLWWKHSNCFHDKIYLFNVYPPQRFKPSNFLLPTLTDGVQRPSEVKLIKEYIEEHKTWIS